MALRPFTMYDSVNTSEIPHWAKAVAGYVGGNWPTYRGLVHAFPKARHLSIAISADEDAHALDIEKGDATIPQAPAWVKRQHTRGVHRPVVYTSVSQAQALIDTLAAAGIRRRRYKLWTAHYTYKQHRCSNVCYPGFHGNADATQYTDKALGRNLDASWCKPRFLGRNHEHTRTDTGPGPGGSGGTELHT